MERGHFLHGGLHDEKGSISLLLLSICSISACAERDKNVPEHDNKINTSVTQSNNDKSDTVQAQTEALQQIKEQIHFDVPLKCHQRYLLERVHFNSYNKDTGRPG